MPRSPSIEAISAVSSPQTNAPAPTRISTWKLNVRPEDAVAEQAVPLGLADRAAQALDRQRVLGAHVDVALVGADRVGGDRHALEHAVRVALQHAAVHERAGVAFVGVADHVLAGSPSALATVLHLAGREAGAAAAAQAAAQ